ncbi:MAG: ABC transporter ATP-binding protein [Chloroflexi bacterium]|nr:ABC transporter ATP-binding protein [Chloroflexota bacterium]
MGIIWRITTKTLKYKWVLLLAYLSVFGVTVFSLMVPRLLGNAVDTVLTSGQRGELLFLAMGIVALSVGRAIAAFGQQYLGESISQWVAYDLRNEFYDHLQRMSFAFHDREQTGNLMSKATADVEGIRMFIQQGLIRALYTILLFAGVGVAMLLLNWQLALVSLLFAPPIVWSTARTTVKLRKEWRTVQDEMGHMTTLLQENLSGQRVVKAFAAEAHERSKFNASAVRVSDHSYTAAILQAFNTSLITIYHLGVTVLILWAGGRLVMAGDLTAGGLAQFIFYLGMLAQPIRMSSMIINSYSRAVSSGQRLFTTLDAASPVKEKPGAIVLPRVQGHVQFENVSFSYDTLSPVLQGINLEAAPARVIALVGAPGSGKSTLVHLLPRFYDATGGRILVDGIDVREVTLQSLRENIGAVQQDVFLFTTTIRENIAYGKVDATQEEIERAAKIAQLHDFIMTLPDGYRTWVGERGITLSGGQRQRLAIARTVLLDPPILILDDSTSSVDTETEHLIRIALTAVMKGRTTFVIAHRVSTVKSADLIVVLRDGQIIQQGTHQELLSVPGPYAEVYELQLRPQEAVLVEGNGHRNGAQVRGESHHGASAAFTTQRGGTQA